MRKSKPERIPQGQGSTKTDRTILTGFLQALAGCVLFVLLTAGAFITGIWSIIADSPGTLSLALFLTGAVGGAFFLWLGIRNFVIASRYNKISLAMGNNSYMKLAELEKKLNRNREQLLRTLRLQIARGLWPDAYLDIEGGALMLGYTPADHFSGSDDPAVNELSVTAEGFIQDMKTISLSVDDPDLRALLEKMTDVTGKIFAFVNDNPNRIRQIRQFSNYYLPATVGLLKNYQELQSLTVKGDNIRDSMEKITTIMADIEAAFEKQFDDLYFDKSLDIHVDVEVMQKMIDSQDSIS